MPVETATYITTLNSSNPPSSDQMSQADDHLRLLKAVLLATFPNLNAAVTATPAQLNQLVARTLGLTDGTATAPPIAFDSEATLGLYRASAGHMSLSQGKRLNGNGTVPVGALVHFAATPVAFSNAGTPGTNTEWLECDGSVYNFSSFPDLGPVLGATYGGNGTTTFGVPNAKDTGRFLRSRTASLAVGTAQANLTAAHTHTASGTTASSGAHVHTVTDAGHTHFVASVDNVNGAALTNSNQVAVVNNNAGNANACTIGGGASAATLGKTSSSTTGISVDSGGAHTHTISLTTDATGGTETRPEALAAILCIKT
jgi:microcystin-dependent protein